jgi:hypothetical protein
LEDGEETQGGKDFEDEDQADGTGASVLIILLFFGCGTLDWKRCSTRVCLWRAPASRCLRTDGPEGGMRAWGGKGPYPLNSNGISKVKSRTQIGSSLGLLC